MSSVGSADGRNSQDDAVRRTRESFQDREADQAKKHAQELRHLTEAHQAEMRELQDTHNKQMEDLRVKTSEALSSRDMKYQREIQDLRELNQSALRKNAQENENRESVTVAAYKSELDRLTQTTQQQKRVLASQYEDQIRKKDQAYEDFAKEARQASQVSSADLRNRLNKEHQIEVKTLVDDRNRQLEQASRDNQNVRRVKDQQIGDLERQKRLDKSQLIAEGESVIKDRDAIHQQNLSIAKDTFENGLKESRRRYDKALEKVAKESQGNVETFKQDVGERLISRMNVGEMTNQNLRNEITRQADRMTKQKNVELANQRDALNDNIEKLEEARHEVVNAANQKNSKELARLQKSKEKSLRETNEFYQGKIEEDKILAKERFERAKMDYDKTAQHQEISTANRFSKLMAQSERDEASLRNYFENASEAQKGNFEVALRDLRERNKKEQNEIFKVFADQSLEREAKFQTKLGEINQKFEKDMLELKQTQEQKIKEQSAVSTREKKQLADQKNLELQRQASQYENKIAKIEDTHKKEVEIMNRKHQESLENLVRTTSARVEAAKKS